MQYNCRAGMLIGDTQAQLLVTKHWRQTYNDSISCKPKPVSSSMTVLLLDAARDTQVCICTQLYTQALQAPMVFNRTCNSHEHCVLQLQACRKLHDCGVVGCCKRQRLLGGFCTPLPAVISQALCAARLQDVRNGWHHKHVILQLHAEQQGVSYHCVQSTDMASSSCMQSTDTASSNCMQSKGHRSCV